MSASNKIRQRRIELGWSQEELAHKMGYKGRSAINKIEVGQRDISQTNLIKFAEVLGVDINYFFDFKENEIEETQDELFNKRKILFDLSAKAKPEDLDKFIKMLEVLTDD